ncbi:4Fe-4S binding protein [Clostridium pasteurianum]|uniref:4Fe-4S binding protein n=1 Tax=Clostridium pasteurianum TaxID=1501 RepID=UPI0022609638|nr:4Fe-4S binding protein [Clostridium pasteurianum]UZW13779.1 4Fe-4S binding protein [Clostridium pasteurianum]
MSKKIKEIQIFRHIIQIILFFLLPGVYILAFSELKSIFQMIIRGNFNFIQSLPGLIEFTVAIIFTILMGRFFCGWFCAFGSFNDWIHIASKKILKTDFKISEKLDSILKYIKYGILALILIFILTGENDILNGTSPWDAFAQITNFSTVISTITIGFIFLILILIGNIFIERFFCRYLCPLGAVFSLISKISILKISKPTEKCGNCRICTNNCSMGLKLYSIDNIRGGECINCLRCVETCHRENPHVNIINTEVNSATASSFVVAIFAGIYGITNFGNSISIQKGLASSNAVISSTVSQGIKYKDGDYPGTGIGFNGGTTKVSVTIKNSKINAIKTISTEDTPDFYKNVENIIPNKIISTQSTSSVDTVSGATYSSKGIIDATQNALNKAK